MTLFHDRWWVQWRTFPFLAERDVKALFYYSGQHLTVYNKIWHLNFRCFVVNGLLVYYLQHIRYILYSRHPLLLSAGLQVTKPNFMTKTVNLADTVYSKPAGDTRNNKRQIKRMKEKNLEEKQTVTPKKRPARGRFICWFLHCTAAFGDNAVFSLIHELRKKSCTFIYFCIRWGGAYTLTKGLPPGSSLQQFLLFCTSSLVF